MTQQSGGPTEQPNERAPANIEKHLQGVNYPANRTDLEQVARSNHAPEEVLQEIRNLPSRDFERREDVTRAFEER